jgi:hypothetical protein
MPRLRTLLPVVVVTFISGCAGPTAEVAGEPEISVRTGPVLAEKVALPLDAYMLDARSEAIVTYATSLIAAKCLARFGYQVVPPPLVEGRPGHPDRFGITDEAEARRYGYHPPPSRLAGPRREPELPPGAYAIMHGEVARSEAGQVPEGGCLGEGRRALGSASAESFALPFALAGEATARARQDRRLLAAFDDWRDCMSKRGHDYPDPWKANDDVRWQGSNVATATEREVAVADVTCKRETNLINIWMAVEAAYQTRSIEENETRLDEVKQTMDAELRAATSVVMSSGTTWSPHVAPR